MSWPRFVLATRNGSKRQQVVVVRAQLSGSIVRRVTLMKHYHVLSCPGERVTLATPPSKGERKSGRATPAARLVALNPLFLVACPGCHRVAALCASLFRRHRLTGYPPPAHPRLACSPAPPACRPADSPARCGGAGGEAGLADAAGHGPSAVVAAGGGGVFAGGGRWESGGVTPAADSACRSGRYFAVSLFFFAPCF